MKYDNRKDSKLHYNPSIYLLTFYTWSWKCISRFIQNTYEKFEKLREKSSNMYPGNNPYKSLPNAVQYKNITRKHSYMSIEMYIS